MNHSPTCTCSFLLHLIDDSKNRNIIINTVSHTEMSCIYKKEKLNVDYPSEEEKDVKRSNQTQHSAYGSKLIGW